MYSDSTHCTPQIKLTIHVGNIFQTSDGLCECLSADLLLQLSSLCKVSNTNSHIKELASRNLPLNCSPARQSVTQLFSQSVSRLSLGSKREFGYIFMWKVYSPIRPLLQHRRLFFAGSQNEHLISRLKLMMQPEFDFVCGISIPPLSLPTRTEAMR